MDNIRENFTPFTAPHTVKPYPTDTASKVDAYNQKIKYFIYVSGATLAVSLVVTPSVTTVALGALAAVVMVVACVMLFSSDVNKALGYLSLSNEDKNRLSRELKSTEEVDEWSQHQNLVNKADVALRFLEKYFVYFKFRILQNEVIEDILQFKIEKEDWQPKNGGLLCYIQKYHNEGDTEKWERWVNKLFNNDNFFGQLRHLNYGSPVDLPKWEDRHRQKIIELAEGCSKSIW